MASGMERSLFMWGCLSVLFSLSIAQETACCVRLIEIGFSSELPVIVVETDGNGTIPDEPKISARLCTCTSQGNYDGPVGIEIRGSTSARDFRKKSFSFETHNAEGDDVDMALLGLASESDWILYGPELDVSLGLRNALTFALAKHLSVFSPATLFVEVFIVEEDSPLALSHYNGLYLFMEKIKRGRNRIDISKDGGSIFKHDNNNLDPGDRHFHLDRSGLDMIMVYPKKKTVTAQQMQSVKQYLDVFEKELLGTEAGSYLQLIDLDSFVDYFLITELSKNPDGYRGSTYMHKDKDGVLKMGPVWDYNEAYGLCCGYPIEGYFDEGRSDGISGGSAISTHGWRFNICADPERCLVDPLDGVSQWYRALWKDTTFEETAQKRWTALREGPFSDESVRTIILNAKLQIEKAAQKNNARWAEVLGYRDANPSLQEIFQIETWTLSRLMWMDTQLRNRPSPSLNVAILPTGLEGFDRSLLGTKKR